jgi:hypothetical protein
MVLESKAAANPNRAAQTRWSISSKTTLPPKWAGMSRENSSRLLRSAWSFVAGALASRLAAMVVHR